MPFLSGLQNWVSQKMDDWTGTAQASTAAAPAPTATPKTTQPLAPDRQAPTSETFPVPATAAPPATQDGTGQTIVAGTFVPTQESQSTTILITQAQQQTEAFRHLVETFDEDKQEPVEWLIRQMITFFCYVAPFVVAFFIGMAIGDTFARDQSSWWMQIGIHLLCLFLEVLMPVLGLSTTITFKRALKDRSHIVAFLVVAAFFLAVSVGNAFALMVLLENGFTWSATNVPLDVALVVRSFGTFTVDLGTTIYLSIANVRSLKKYLADQRKKIEAVRDVNTINIELEETNMKAGMDRVQAYSEMQSKQQRMATLNEAERLTHQAVIEGMKKKLETNDDHGGRSRYGGWN